MRRSYDQPCSLACALDHIGERWALLVIRELMLGPLRFSELARAVGGAPTDVLTKRLRDLEQDGIVQRRELAPPASGTAYELTELGRGLEAPLLALGRWGLNFQPASTAFEISPPLLANALRIVLQAPADLVMTLQLHTGGQDFRLRIQDGWIAAERGVGDDPDLTLTGEPGSIMAMLAGAAPEQAGVEVEGDSDGLERLRAMVELPEQLRAEVGAAVAALTATA
jgi:DNA-binding HxlR family transcriptional regulator